MLHTNLITIIFKIIRLPLAHIKIIIPINILQSFPCFYNLLTTCNKWKKICFTFSDVKESQSILMLLLLPFYFFSFKAIPVFQLFIFINNVIPNSPCYKKKCLHFDVLEKYISLHKILELVNHSCCCPSHQKQQVTSNQLYRNFLNLYKKSLI